MEPDKKDDNKKMFKSIFQSSIRASYFNHLQENKATSQSKIQIEKIEEEEEVD